MLPFRHVGPPVSQQKPDPYYGYYQQPSYQPSYPTPDYSRQTTGISMSSQGSHEVPRGDVHPVHHSSPSFSSHYVPGVGMHSASSHSQHQSAEEMAG